jgi:general secretion pathway protein H
MPIRPSKTGSPYREAGYTLVELLVVFAIMGLVIAAVPALINRAMPGLQSTSAARALAADLRTARSAAISHNRQLRFVFAPEQQTYSLAQQPRHRLPYGVPFALPPRGGNEIDFFADGSSSGGVILVGGKGHQHRVVTDWLTGRVSVDE